MFFELYNHRDCARPQRQAEERSLAAAVIQFQAM